MFSLTVLLGAFIVSTVQSSTVFVNIPYEIEEGKILIFERYQNEVILNEYPAFYSILDLPKFSNITSQTGDYTMGYVIGSFENYYPITPLKSEMHCGHFSVKQLVGSNRTITYRFFTWETAEDFLFDINNYIDSSLLNLFKQKLCFVYAETI